MRESRDKIIEIWSDSFKEGEWFLQNLASTYYEDRFSVNFRYNFQPIFKFRNEDGRSFVAEVYGHYSTWTPVPDVIKNVLKYGKPDIIVYNPLNKKIILSIEETAAVPTGNQSLQRLERVWFAAKSKIPFVYLISEYGLHVDGGVRKSSIWPAYLALKLSSQYQIPSLTLFYGSLTSPENYSVGSGVSVLTELSFIYIMEWLGYNVKEEKEKLLRSLFRSMCTFVLGQAEDIAILLPGLTMMNDTLIDFLMERVK